MNFYLVKDLIRFEKLKKNGHCDIWPCNKQYANDTQPNIALIWPEWYFASVLVSFAIRDMD